MIGDKLLCPNCKETFDEKHGNDVYCSVRCEDLAQKKRQKEERDPVKELLLIVKHNHKGLKAMDDAGIVEPSRDDLELYGVDISLSRFIHLPGLEEGQIVMHFGEYNLITDKDFQKFKIIKNETAN